MKWGDNDLNRMLSFCLVFFLLVSTMFSSVNASLQSSVEDSNEVQTQVDFLNESTIHDLDSNSVKNSTFNTSNSRDVDVMIAYTSAASNWSSSNDGGIENTIGEAMDNINTAIENSEIDLDINLVHSCKVSYTETGDDLVTDLQRLERDYDGHMEEVHDLRDYHGADLVSLFVRRDDDSYVAGVARGPQYEHQLNPDYAFSVVSVQDISSSYVFTHEIGHNFGAGHAADQDHQPGPQLYDYSAGWRWRGDKLLYDYVSVMTYIDSLYDERVLHFSNPDVYHEGDPTGDPEEADNARTIRETKGIISDYQEPTPQIDITSPSFGEELYQGMEQKIEWETVSGDNSVSHIDLYYSLDNGTTWNTVEEGVQDTGSYNWKVPLEETDSALIGAEATDEAGFSRNDFTSFEIKIDDIPPEIDLIEPKEGEIFRQQELTVKWNGSDHYSGIDRYEVTSFGVDWEESVITEDGQHTFTNLENGEHEIKVSAFDNAGNENTISVNITIDTIPPNLNINYPIDGEVLEPGDVTVFWNGFDNISGISHFEIRIGEGDWIMVRKDTIHTFEDLDEGEYTVEIRAADKAGNTAVENVEFEVEEQTVLGTVIDLFFGYIQILAIVFFGLLMVFFLIAKKKKFHSSQREYKSLALKDMAECGNCGSVIPGYLSNCSKCGVEFSDMVKCKNCGSEIYDDVDECPECGYDFRLNDEELGDL